MPVNIEEIKKLSDEEKLKIIDELLESIDGDYINQHLSDADEDSILKERWEEYKAGKTKFYSWEEARKRLIDKAQERLNKGNNDISA